METENRTALPLSTHEGKNRILSSSYKAGLVKNRKTYFDDTPVKTAQFLLLLTIVWWGIVRQSLFVGCACVVGERK